MSHTPATETQASQPVLRPVTWEIVRASRAATAYYIVLDTTPFSFIACAMGAESLD